MKEKEFYISPDVLIFNVKVGGIICVSGLGAPGAAGLGFQNGDNINDYTGFDF